MKRIIRHFSKINTTQLKNVAEVKEMFLDIFIKMFNDTISKICVRLAHVSYEKRLNWMRHHATSRLSEEQKKQLNDDDGLDMLYEVCQTLFLVL